MLNIKRIERMLRQAKNELPKGKLPTEKIDGKKKKHRIKK